SLEVAVPVLLAGPILLAVLAASRSQRERVAGELRVVLAVVAATLGVPVLFSTAGALEMQAAALAWILAWSFVLEHALDAAARASARGRGAPLGQQQVHHAAVAAHAFALALGPEVRIVDAVLHLREPALVARPPCRERGEVALHRPRQRAPHGIERRTVRDA